MPKDVYAELDALNVPFERYDHPAVFTVAESRKLDARIPGRHTKNLFLEAEPSGKLYLLTVAAEKRVDLKSLAAQVGEKRFSFCKPEQLREVLGLTPGSVSPLGLLNDTERRATFLLDGDLSGADSLAVHPNINTATVVIETGAFTKLFERLGYTVHRCTT